jgi:hypothetical protein
LVGLFERRARLTTFKTRRRILAASAGLPLTAALPARAQNAQDPILSSNDRQAAQLVDRVIHKHCKQEEENSSSRACRTHRRR